MVSPTEVVAFTTGFSRWQALLSTITRENLLKLPFVVFRLLLRTFRVSHLLLKDTVRLTLVFKALYHKVLMLLPSSSFNGLLEFLTHDRETLFQHAHP